MREYVRHRDPRRRWDQQEIEETIDDDKFDIAVENEIQALLEGENYLYEYSFLELGGYLEQIKKSVEFLRRHATSYQKVFESLQGAIHSAYYRLECVDRDGNRDSAQTLAYYRQLYDYTGVEPQIVEPVNERYVSEVLKHPELYYFGRNINEGIQTEITDSRTVDTNELIKDALLDCPHETVQKTLDTYIESYVKQRSNSKPEEWDEHKWWNEDPRLRAAQLKRAFPSLTVDAVSAGDVPTAELESALGRITQVLMNRNKTSTDSGTVASIAYYIREFIRIATDLNTLFGIPFVPSETLMRELNDVPGEVYNSIKENSSGAIAIGDLFVQLRSLGVSVEQHRTARTEAAASIVVQELGQDTFHEFSIDPDVLSKRLAIIFAEPIPLDDALAEACYNRVLATMWHFIGSTLGAIETLFGTTRCFKPQEIIRYVSRVYGFQTDSVDRLREQLLDVFGTNDAVIAAAPLLYEGASYCKNSTLWSQIQRLTGIAPQFDASTSARIVTTILTEPTQMEYVVESLQQFEQQSGAPIDLELFRPQVQEAYRNIIRAMIARTMQCNNGIAIYDKLQEHTHIPCECEISEAQSFYDDLAMKHDEGRIPQIAATIETITGVPKKFSEKTVITWGSAVLEKREEWRLVEFVTVVAAVPWESLDVQAHYRTYLLEFAESNGIYFMELVQRHSGIAPAFSMEVINEYITNELVNSSFNNVRYVIARWGKGIQWNGHQETVNRCIQECLIGKNKKKLHELLLIIQQPVTEISQEVVVASIQQLLKDRNIDQIKKSAEEGVSIPWDVLKNDVTNAFNDILENVEDASAKKLITALSILSHHPPQLERDIVQSRCASELEKGKLEALETTVSIPGVTVDWSALATEIATCYDVIFGTQSASNIVPLSKRLQKVCGVEPTFSVVTVRTKCKQTLEQIDINEITKLNSNPYVQINWSDVEGDVQQCFHTIITTRSAVEIKKLIDAVRQGTNIEPRWNRTTVIQRCANLLLSKSFTRALTVTEIVVGAQDTAAVHELLRDAFSTAFLNDPYAAHGLCQSIERTANDESTRPVIDAICHSPWFAAYQKILKCQQPSANEENDPWRKELQPFLVALRINPADRRAPEMVAGFINEMGMLNLPELFLLYRECQTANDFNSLPNSIQRTITEFGITLRKPADAGGGWRYISPRAVFQEIRRRVSLWPAELLEDRIPRGIKSALGNELFHSIRGKTKWERGHSLAGLIQQIEARAAASWLQVPSRYHRSIFSVPVRVSEEPKLDSTPKDTERKLAVLLSSKETEQIYLPLALGVHNGVHCTEPAQWWQDQRGVIVKEIAGQITLLEEALALPVDTIQELVVATTDLAEKKRLQSLLNPNARKGMEAKIAELRHVRSVVEGVTLEGMKEEDMNAFMERLATIPPHYPWRQDALRTISSRHFIAHAPEGFREALRHAFTDEPTASAERVRLLASCSREYIQEHYLHQEQQQEHTGHLPFSEQLRNELRTLWSLQGEKMPIEQLWAKVRSIIEPSYIKGTKTIDVQMIPVRKILHVFAGDIGDSCQSSQHHSIAFGEYPGLYTWIYATKTREKPEVLRGSVHAIETKSSEGDLNALVVRANNPLENFIQTVDAKSFVFASLREAAATQRRAWKKGERRCVLIPLDDASESSTNRPSVARVYKQHFESCKKIALVNNKDTNFNNYNIWDASGSYACGMIWEIDEEGKETYHGTWPEEQRTASV